MNGKDAGGRMKDESSDKDQKMETRIIIV